MEGPHFSLAEPHIPVHAFRHGIFGHGADAHRFAVIGAQHQVNPPQTAGTHKVTGHAVHGHGTLLAAHLEDAVILAHCPHEHTAFFDIQRHRLFGVDVLTRLHGVDGAKHSCVVVGTDDDAVDIFLFEQRRV